MTIDRTFVSGMSYYVPAMTAAADLAQNLHQRINFGAPVVADPDGIIDGQSIATAGNTTTFASAYSVANMSKFGRNIRVVSDGAATSTVTILGRDYLGQVVTETLTLNGTTTVEGVKAFKYVDKVTWAATASRTVDVGWGNKLGLPYKTVAVEREIEDGVLASAGTLAAAITTDPATATTGDPRGLYTPTGTLDGTAVFEIDAVFDKAINSSNNGGLHGIAHFAG